MYSQFMMHGQKNIKSWERNSELWWEKLRERERERETLRRYMRRWEDNIKTDLKWDGKP